MSGLRIANITDDPAKSFDNSTMDARFFSKVKPKVDCSHRMTYSWREEAAYKLIDIAGTKLDILMNP